MNDFQKKYLLKRQDYGILYPYLMEESVTDIDWNGKQLWINDLEKGRYLADEHLPEIFVERFVMLLSNVTGITFNRTNPVLEAETEELRISVVHESVARTGVTISIRKVPGVCRMDEEMMIATRYCSKEICDFLIHCIKSHCTMIICGLPGVGKTELLKFLTQYIEASERVITIEDVMEIHYQSLNPQKDCIEMKVAENFSYAQAIKTSLRQFPKWIILSEARSEEARQLLESLSTGASGLTTIHASHVKNIPKRLLQMMAERGNREYIERDIFQFIDIGILIRSEIDNLGKYRRWIEEIGIFEKGGTNEIQMVVEEGKEVVPLGGLYEKVASFH